MMDARKQNGRNIFKVVYDTYKDFAENTSIHGLKYTVKKKVTIAEKIFWIFVIICGFCGAAYMTILFWERYLSNPTRTTISTSYAPISTMPFPAVTICNINRIFETKIESLLKKCTHYKITNPKKFWQIYSWGRVILPRSFWIMRKLNEEDNELAKRALPQLLAVSDPDAIKYNVTELNQLQIILGRKNVSNISEVIKEIGQTCTEMFTYCSWNGQVKNCLGMFDETLTTDGFCCTLNSFGITGGERLYTGYNGIGSGLFLILNPMLQSVQYSSLYGSGFKIIIHDKDEFPGSQSITRIVSINRLSLIQLFGTKMTCSNDVKNLPISQRHCLYPEESPRGYYSDINCLTNCEANMYYMQCGCTPYFFSFLGGNLTRTCDCMPQCESDYYTVITAATNFDRNLQNISMMAFDDRILKKDPVILNIYFLEQTHTIYLRDTITSTIYLLSSFGGVYSLFMGCSLITVLEILYYGIFRFMVNLNIFRKVKDREKPVKVFKSQNSKVFRIPDTYDIKRFERNRDIFIN